MFKRKKTSQTPIDTDQQQERERQNLRGGLIIELHAALTEILIDISKGLTLDEMHIRMCVYLAATRQVECDLEYVCKTLSISKTSATRKLTKLVEMGYVDRSKVGRKLVFLPPKGIEKLKFVYEDGRSTTEVAIEEIMHVVERLVR
jgi:DNA-binding MarR family transcriptional regulator